MDSNRTNALLKAVGAWCESNYLYLSPNKPQGIRFPTGKNMVPN